MNTKTQEALKMAVEALELAADYLAGDDKFDVYKLDKAFFACKEALAQPAQEAVAWLHIQGGHEEVSCRELDKQELERGWEQKPLYTHPAPPQEPVEYCKHGVPKGVCTLGEKDCNPAPAWQGLSDDDVKAIEEVLGIDKVYIRAVERTLKEKNHD